MSDDAAQVSHSLDVDPRARRLLGPFHVLGQFWHHLHHWGARHGFLIAPVTAFWVVFFFLVLGAYRRALVANLAIVMGPTSWWRGRLRALRVIWNWACCRNERYERLQKRRREMDVRVEGLEHWRALCGSGNGFLLLTAHLGSYESGLLIPGERIPRRLHMVRARELDPDSQRFVEETVRKYAEEHVEHHFLDPNDIRGGLALRDALAAGEIVALPGDRPMPGGKTVTTEMFGRRFDIPAGPFVLARASKIPAMSIFFLREGKRRYRLIFREPFEVSSTRDRGADVDVGAQQFATDMEWAIREAPEQWFCFREVWPESGANAGDGASTDD